MKSIVVLEDFLYGQVPLLLDRLTADLTPLWGSMTATGMIRHLALTFRVSNGKLTVPLTSDPEKVERIKTIGLLGEKPFPKGFNNPLLAKAPVETAITFEAARLHLQQEVADFKQIFEKGPEHLYMHNIFGLLNYHEWLWFHYKHINHHFAQFKLVPYTERFGS